MADVNGVKETKELYYKILKDVNEGLKKLRERCPHEHTFEGDYEWRPAATFRALICDDCGAVVKNLDSQILTEQP
jgi:hypothetical protein